MKLKRAGAFLLTALLAGTFAGCGSGAGSKDAAEESKGAQAGVKETAEGPIRIATKKMPEQFILSEMLKLVIEDSTDYTAEITKGLGSTDIIQQAMEQDEFDLYPEYTSTGWVLVLGHEAGEADDAEMFTRLNEEYGEKYDMSWVGMYGFNNTYTVAVRKDVADQYNLAKTSDLKPVAGKLVFGGNPDYIEREDGFGAVCDAYDLKFKDVKEIDIGLKYEAMKRGDIDVTNAYTTDAQLGGDDVTALEDDKNLQVNYYASTVVRNQALENYPGLEEALMKMDGILSDEEMAGLNYQLEVENKDEAEIAKDYLVSKGIIEES